MDWKKQIKERNYFLQEIDRNELMSKKKKKNFHTTLSYIEHFFILVFTVTGCICISGFISLVGIPTEIMSFVIGLESCAITVEIKKYRSAHFEKEKGIIK